MPHLHSLSRLVTPNPYPMHVAELAPEFIVLGLLFGIELAAVDLCHFLSWKSGLRIESEGLYSRFQIKNSPKDYIVAKNSILVS